MTSLIGDSMFAYSLTGQVPQPDGNFHPEMCPHAAYRCADDEWISIAVADGAEWQALCKVLGADELAAGQVTVKWLQQGEQLTIGRGELADHLQQGLGAFS